MSYELINYKLKKKFYQTKPYTLFIIFTMKVDRTWSEGVLAQSATMVQSEEKGGYLQDTPMPK